MNIFITTCSRNKISGGKEYTYYSWKNERRTALMRTRANVLDLMNKGELKSGLQLPVAGPDFGGKEDGQFLPAHKRYRGGSFLGGLLASKRKLSEWHKTNRLYFLSALYGLVRFEEPIQNYDLRLEPSIEAMWRESRLADLLMQDMRNRRQACTVINCCGDEHYGNLIQWERLIHEGYDIRHAKSRGDLEPGQIRWTAGRLAGDGDDRISDLIRYEECRYTSDSGSITLFREAPAAAGGGGS